MDLDQVRASLVEIRERAYGKLTEMAPLELAIYFKSGMYWPSYSPSETRKINLNLLQPLINLYVETKPLDFREKFMMHLNGDNRHNEVYEVGGEEELDREMARSFASDLTKTIKFYEESKVEKLSGRRVRGN